MKEILKELALYFSQRRKFWLLPVFLFVLLIGGALVFAQGSPSVSYTHLTLPTKRIV